MDGHETAKGSLADLTQTGKRSYLEPIALIGHDVGSNEGRKG